MIEFEVTVRSAAFVGPHTRLVLSEPEDFDYSGPSLDWPVRLFIPGDVKVPIGTKYKITVEKLP